MTLGFLKIKKTITVKLNRALIFESKSALLLLLRTLILIPFSGSGNNFVALILMSFKYL